MTKYPFIDFNPESQEVKANIRAQYVLVGRENVQCPCHSNKLTRFIDL